MSTISATHALNLLQAGKHGFIDVRSELEYAKGYIPGFENEAILHDSERQAVGISYKLEGQDAAIRLGHQLVDPSRGERVASWLKIGESYWGHPIVLNCWRGGLRSQIACSWIQEAGREVLRVEGGYKSMRAELLQTLVPVDGFIVLSGKSGSGKTALLKEIPFANKLDLEGLVSHRGSSFGNVWQRSQPAQATFENALALHNRKTQGPVLVEDESKVIGSLHIPEVFYREMLRSSVVRIEMPLELRTETLFKDYVEEPLGAGMEEDVLKARLMASVQSMERRLGGALTMTLVKKIEIAFQSPDLFPELHKDWIQTLLRDYYDRAYEHSEARSPRVELFRGSYEECRQWILNQYG